VTDDGYIRLLRGCLEAQQRDIDLLRSQLAAQDTLISALQDQLLDAMEPLVQAVLPTGVEADPPQQEQWIFEAVANQNWEMN
jgi:hypothetical protein